MEYSYYTLENVRELLEGKFDVSVYKKFFTAGVEGSIDVLFKSDEKKVYFEEGKSLEIIFDNGEDSVILKISGREYFRVAKYANVIEIWFDEFTRISVYVN